MKPRFKVGDKVAFHTDEEYPGEVWEVDEVYPTAVEIYLLRDPHIRDVPQFVEIYPYLNGLERILEGL